MNGCPNHFELSILSLCWGSDLFRLLLCCFSLWICLCWRFVPIVWLSWVWVLIMLWRGWESCSLHYSSNDFALSLVVQSISFVWVICLSSCKFSCTSFWLNFYSQWCGMIGFKLFVMFCFECFVVVLSLLLLFDSKLLVCTLFLKIISFGIVSTFTLFFLSVNSQFVCSTVYGRGWLSLDLPIDFESGVIDGRCRLEQVCIFFRLFVVTDNMEPPTAWMGLVFLFSLSSKFVSSLMSTLSDSLFTSLLIY